MLCKFLLLVGLIVAQFAEGAVFFMYHYARFLILRKRLCIVDCLVLRIEQLYRLFAVVELDLPLAVGLALGYVIYLGLRRGLGHVSALRGGLLFGLFRRLFCLLHRFGRGSRLCGGRLCLFGLLLHRFLLCGRLLRGGRGRSGLCGLFLHRLFGGGRLLFYGPRPARVQPRAVPPLRERRIPLLRSVLF